VVRQQSGAAAPRGQGHLPRPDRLAPVQTTVPALTAVAEGGTSTPMLLARSRHASVWSLERYARPGVDAVARHVAERDPAARRKGCASGTYR
jgi:hypothetical protein